MIGFFAQDEFKQDCGDAVSFGFYGREGGVSEGIYQSLNCGVGSGDDPQAVAENRKRIAAHLGHAGAAVSTLWQIHSPICLTLDAPLMQSGEDRPKADAMVTDKSGVIIGALSADCGPVLLRGQKANGAPIIGAAHAGWGGALAGVLEQTVQSMLHGGAVMQTIAACLGPCLHQESYEVQESFSHQFLEHDKTAAQFFKPAAKQGHCMFDLPAYCVFRLKKAGVQRIFTIPIDTYANEQTCFSYRRATHRNEGDYGRQVSAIVINP
jgi:polyphenol oxidase